MTNAARHGIGMLNIGQTLCKRMPPTDPQLKRVLVTWLHSMRHLHYHGAVLPKTICMPHKKKAHGQRLEPPSTNVNFNFGGSQIAAWKAANKMLKGHDNNCSRPLSSRSIASAEAFASAICGEYTSNEAALRGAFTISGPASQALRAEPVQPDHPPMASRNMASKVAEGCSLPTEEGNRIRWSWEGNRHIIHMRGQEQAYNPFPGCRLLSHMLIHWTSIYNIFACLGAARTINPNSRITEQKRWSKAGPDPTQLKIALGRAADAAWGSPEDGKEPRAPGRYEECRAK